MTVLPAGGAGYIGSHMAVELLQYNIAAEDIDGEEAGCFTL